MRPEISFLWCHECLTGERGKEEHEDMKTGKEKDHEDIAWARKILGLGKTATLKEIKDAYRRASKRWHPDHRLATKDPDSNKKMQEVNRAYQVLLEFISNYRYVLVPGKDEKFDAEAWWWKKFGTVFAGNIKKKRDDDK